MPIVYYYHATIAGVTYKGAILYIIVDGKFEIVEFISIR
jgi:hypothetical protein